MKTKKQFNYPTSDDQSIPGIYSFLTQLGQQLVNYLRDVFNDLSDLQTPVDSLPTASVDYRGKFALLRGGTGVADILYVCTKNAADAYVWKVVTIV